MSFNYTKQQEEPCKPHAARIDACQTRERYSLSVPAIVQVQSDNVKDTSSNVNLHCCRNDPPPQANPFPTSLEFNLAVFAVLIRGFRGPNNVEVLWFKITEFKDFKLFFV